jgi:hypothetical protein
MIIDNRCFEMTQFLYFMDIFSIFDRSKTFRIDCDLFDEFIRKQFESMNLQINTMTRLYLNIAQHVRHN